MLLELLALQVIPGLLVQLAQQEQPVLLVLQEIQVLLELLALQVTPGLLA